jgi:hypothetical protein
MLSDDEIDAIAQKHVRKNHPDCEILHRERWLEPDGIYFVVNRLDEHGDLYYFESAGFFVARVSGEIWKIGYGQISHEDLEYWLKWYAEGWRPGKYRLIVQELKSPRRFAHLLVEQRVSYYMREVENDIVWTHEVTADEEAVLDRLKKLPCTFMVSADLLRVILPLVEANGLAKVEYDYIGESPKYDWRPENNTPEQLGPQWDRSSPRNDESHTIE